MTMLRAGAGFGTILAALVFCLAVAGTVGQGLAQQTPSISLDDVMNQSSRSVGGSVRPPADAVVPIPSEPGEQRIRDAEEGGAKNPDDPLGIRGPNSDTTLWAEIRAGETFTTQSPTPVSDFLVQDEGMSWLTLRAKDGPLQFWTMVGAAGMLGGLTLFYLLRGRVRIDSGFSGRLIERFAGWERFGHWLLATSFILLALTGANLLFGKDYLMPLIGKEAFAQIALAGKWVHNHVSWAFMIALVYVFVAWALHNLPSINDLRWIAVGGGLFHKNIHPPARKFNAGQKIFFWSAIILGGSASASGLSLMFPYELPMFGATFAVLNDLGISQAVVGEALPTVLTPIQEMQYAQLWHTIVGMALAIAILAHIYIGSVGMEGAFAAMGSGMVDRNWALEHHKLWVAEVEERTAREARKGGAATPAE